MSHLNPHKLHVEYMGNIFPDGPITKRTYTLTHSDSTGDLFLTIGAAYNLPQISGWYTRFMRDEVLAEWHFEVEPSLHVYCHVSGGLVFGLPGWRKSIFIRHMPMVLEAFRYGDRQFVEAHPELDESKVWVHYRARGPRHNQVETWGRLSDYTYIGAEK
jgi:hypothetical protein